MELDMFLKVLRTVKNMNTTGQIKTFQGVENSTELWTVPDRLKFLKLLETVDNMNDTGLDAKYNPSFLSESD